VLRQAPVKILYWLKGARLLLLEPLHDAEFRQLGGIAHLRGLKLGKWGVRADLWVALRGTQCSRLTVPGLPLVAGISGAANRNPDRM
jgi:hypothetical protein